MICRIGMKPSCFRMLPLMPEGPLALLLILFISPFIWKWWRGHFYLVCLGLWCCVDYCHWYYYVSMFWLDCGCLEHVCCVDLSDGLCIFVFAKTFVWSCGSVTSLFSYFRKVSLLFGLVPFRFLIVLKKLFGSLFLIVSISFNLLAQYFVKS